MAEGDTILRLVRASKRRWSARRSRPAPPTRAGAPPGSSGSTGSTLERAEARGKHLLLGFGELSLHSHLGMSGGWHLYRRGAAWRRPRRSAWAVLSGGGWDAVQFGGPTLRVMTTAKLRRHPQIDRPRPRHPRSRSFDLDAVLAGAARRPGPRARRRPARPAPGRRDRQHLQERGLLRRPGRSLAAGRRPLRRGAARGRRRRPQADAGRGRDRPPHLRDLPPPAGVCPRCRGPVSSRGQGDANRTTYWCPRCQA